MTTWLPFLLVVAVIIWCHWRERKPKQPDRSFGPWYVRLKPRSRK